MRVKAIQDLAQLSDEALFSEIEGGAELCVSNAQQIHEDSLALQGAYRWALLPSATFHLPSPTASLGLDYAACSPSPRTFALRLPPDKPSRGCPCRRLVVILLTMSPSRYSHRGLAPHKFAPMLGAHRALNRTHCGGLAIGLQKPSPNTSPPQWADYLKR